MRILTMTLLILAMHSCNGQKKDFFEIRKIVYTFLGDSREGYKIVLKDNSVSSTYDSSALSTYSEPDAFAMITELLNLKGNMQKCALPVICYNPLRSQIYIGENKTYTIQMEALFMINQVYFRRPFIFSSFPVIYNTKTKQCLLGTEPEMDEVYRLYNSWFEKVKKMGLEKSRNEKVFPLEGSIYRWY